MSIPSIASVYVAVFGRPADLSGTAWMTSLTNGRTDLTGLDLLSQTDEFTARFAGLVTGAALSALYQSLFNRDPDLEGLSFWKAKLDAGGNLAQIAVAIATSAFGDDKAVFEAKVGVAERFTKMLDTPPEVVAYTGAPAVAFGHKLLNSVDATHEPSDREMQSALHEFILAWSSTAPIVVVGQIFDQFLA